MPLLCLNTVSCSSPHANTTLPKLGTDSEKDTPVQMNGNANLHMVKSTKVAPTASGKDGIAKAPLVSTCKLGNTAKAG
ncbi:unnamed protein product [Trichobilharzia regenti]|nr:unnamed protein product [Trichobilharzia regenti]